MREKRPCWRRSVASLRQPPRNCRHWRSGWLFLRMAQEWIGLTPGRSRTFRSSRPPRFGAPGSRDRQRHLFGRTPRCDRWHSDDKDPRHFGFNRLRSGGLANCRLVRCVLLSRLGVNPPSFKHHDHRAPEPARLGASEGSAPHRPRPAGVPFCQYPTQPVTTGIEAEP